MTTDPEAAAALLSAASELLASGKLSADAPATAFTSLTKTNARKLALVQKIRTKGNPAAADVVDQFNVVDRDDVIVITASKALAASAKEAGVNEAIKVATAALGWGEYRIELVD